MQSQVAQKIQPSAPYLHLVSNTKQHEPYNLNRIGMKQEVYPFKSQEQIIAMQRYYLSRAKKAKSPNAKNGFLRDLLYFTLGINIGFRGGDITHLRWKDILNPDGTVITDPLHYFTEEKTSKFRQLVFNQDCKRMISFYLHETGILPSPERYVFLAHPDCTNPITLNGIRASLKKAAKACGITFNVGTHSLRKTFGYRYYALTGDILTLQKLFNHTTSAVTLRYIGMDYETIYEAYQQVEGTSLTDEELYGEEEIG